MNTESPWEIQPPSPLGPAAPGKSVRERYRGDVQAAAALTVLGGLLGLAVGALWEHFATPVQGVVSQGAVYFSAPESESEIAHDGWFAIFAVAAALLTGAVAFLAFRRRGAFGAVLGVAAGSVGGAYLAAWFGGEISPGHGSITRAARGVAANVTFNLPSILRATGVIWLWPLVAMALFFLLYLLFGPVADDESAEPEGTGQRPAWAGWGTETPVVHEERPQGGGDDGPDDGQGGGGPDGQDAGGDEGAEGADGAENGEDAQRPE
jgi:hypothetical protein